RAIGAGTPTREDLVASRGAVRKGPRDAGRAIAGRSKQVVRAVKAVGCAGGGPFALDADHAVGVVHDELRGRRGGCQWQAREQPRQCDNQSADARATVPLGARALWPLESPVPIWVVG